MTTTSARFLRRIVWTRIWGMMARHFAAVGCHKNNMVSMYAIDSLRQLSFKFLEKPELKDFNFQRVFLTPFMVIMESESSREDVRELILRCVDNMVRALAANMRSGWKTIFGILSMSAVDSSLTIAKLGMGILHRLLDECLEQLCRSSEDFVALVKTSMSFVHTGGGVLPVGLSMRALCYVACCADAIGGGIVKPENDRGSEAVDGASQSMSYEGLEAEDATYMALWRPIIDGLATGMINAAGEGLVAQRGCVCTLRAILLRWGANFTVAQWRCIIEQSIAPAFSLAIERDSSGIKCLFSDNPLRKNFGMLRAPPGKVPCVEDAALKELALEAQSEGSSCARDMGVAECLVEAMLMDLRRGGDGSAQQRSVAEEGRKMGNRDGEESFGKTSWIVNTAPYVIGLVVDLCSAWFIGKGAEARDVLLPLVVEVLTIFNLPDETPVCEALLRLSYRELARLGKDAVDAQERVGETEASGWCRALVRTYAKLLKGIVAEQSRWSKMLVDRRMQLRREAALRAEREANKIEDLKKVETDYGVGEVFETRSPDGAVVRLQWGATLYAAGGSVQVPSWNSFSDDEGDEDAAPDAEVGATAEEIAELSIQGRKIESSPLIMWTAACDLFQRELVSVLIGLEGLFGDEEFKLILSALEESRQFSLSCRRNGDVMVDVDCFGGGLEAFFVCQEAGSLAAKLKLLIRVHCGASSSKRREGGVGGTGGSSDGSGSHFSEKILINLMFESLRSYLAADRMFKKAEKGGDEEDAKVASSKRGITAWYLSRFNPVVEEVLRGIASLNDSQFRRHKYELYDVVVGMVEVENFEIRMLLKDILVRFRGILQN